MSGTMRLVLVGAAIALVIALGGVMYQLMNLGGDRSRADASPMPERGDPVAPGASAELALIFPVACERGVDCWVAQYPDVDPGPGVLDPACGARAYEGHKGTDIAVRDLATVTAGVAVLAPADGVVTAVRDGEPAALTEALRDLAEGAGRECGNGVVIDHGGGWETQSCHLKAGSLVVEEGQTVRRGEVLGQVGQSGLAEFPHLHLSVRKNGEAINPFSSQRLEAGCEAAGPSLWAPAANVSVEPAVMSRAGFAPGPVEVEDLELDGSSPATLAADGPALVFWAEAYGVRDGDMFALLLTGPDGEVVENEEWLTRDQARRMQFAGRRTPEGGWTPGVYTGVAKLMRGDAMLGVIERTVVVQ